MLLFFALENWMSYREPYAFSMMATPVATASEHLAIIPQGRRVLPISVIFGGNASGKSNFFDALAFLRAFVTGRYRAADGLPFLLDRQKREDPTNFQLDILIHDHIFRYQLSFDRSIVLHEALYELDTELKVKNKVFLRKAETGISSDTLEEDTLKQINLYANSDQEDRLLLAHLANYSPAAADVYNWFQNSLSVQNSRFTEDKALDLPDLLDRQPQLLDLINKILPLLDNGIDHFELGRNDKREVFAIHQDSEGEQIRFPLSREASGVRHLLEILPPLILSIDDELADSHVMIIDEWDHNLHSLLTIELISFYLRRRKASARSQLIISSHDLHLLNRELFRSDELWVTERLSDGSSTLLPLSDFRALDDEAVDYRQLYLEGRLGGLPKLNAFILSDWRENDPEDDE